jgi:hypothetical protein
MKLYALVALALVGFPHCALSSEDPRGDLCKLLPEGNICSKPSTAIFGKPPPNSVSETETELTLTLKDGTKKRWQNSEKGRPFGVATFFLEHKYFWVFGMHYETQSDELISYETGNYYAFDNEHLYVSPDGKLILAERNHHGGYPSSLGIHSISKKGLTELQRFPVGELRYCGILWINPSEVAFFSCRYDPKTTATYATAPVVARIKKNSDRWTFSEEKKQ